MCVHVCECVCLCVSACAEPLFVPGYLDRGECCSML